MHSVTTGSQKLGSSIRLNSWNSSVFQDNTAAPAAEETCHNDNMPNRSQHSKAAAESIKASVCFARGPFCPQRSSTQAAQHPRMKGTASHSGVSTGARRFAAPVIKMAVGPSAPPMTPMPEL